eukprot:3714574-Pleurochrysis_carterae.AAC.2
MRDKGRARGRGKAVPPAAPFGTPKSIRAWGREDMTLIIDDDVLLGYKTRNIITLILSEMYKHPQNRNLHIPNIKLSSILVFTGEDLWTVFTKEDVSRALLNRALDHAYEVWSRYDDVLAAAAAAAADGSGPKGSSLILTTDEHLALHDHIDRIKTNEKAYKKALRQVNDFILTEIRHWPVTGFVKVAVTIAAEAKAAS